MIVIFLKQEEQLVNDSDRHNLISGYLKDRPFVSVRELQDALHVSSATIRRDIDKLHRLGKLRKVYGGATANEVSGAGFEAFSLGFSENRDIAVRAKKAIAREAARLVVDGSRIIVHGGSTCFAFGCEIARRNVFVFTQSMPLASYLYENGTCQLQVGGGEFHKDPGILYSPDAGQATFFAAQFFVGALGVSPLGALEQNPLLIHQSAYLSRNATEVILLADSRKFEIDTLPVAIPAANITRIITDDGLTDRHAKMLDEYGISYTIASSDNDNE